MTASFGRRFDREPWDWVQRAVFAFLFLSVLGLIYVMVTGAVEATIGEVRLSEFGTAIGCLGIAPWIVRPMIRTPTYRKMGRANAWTCCVAVFVAASALSAETLLLINLGGKAGPPTSASDFTITAVNYGRRPAPTIVVDITNVTYGWREIHTWKRYWRDIDPDHPFPRVGNELTLVLRVGRLGLPIITGYKNGAHGAVYPLRRVRASAPPAN
jgi:hypothetical protein